MKNFQFSLQAVLTVREQAERVAQQACARAYTAVEIAAEKVMSADLALTASHNQRRTQLTAGATAADLEQSRLHAVLLNEQRLRMVLELADANRLAEEAWRELLAATQKREALDRLRKRKRRAHEYAAARAEQKLLDDLSGRPTLSDQWRENHETL